MYWNPFESRLFVLWAALLVLYPVGLVVVSLIQYYLALTSCAVAGGTETFGEFANCTFRIVATFQSPIE